MPYPLLSAIAGMSEEELHRGLSSLQASEFIYETNLFPEREFTFKHALTHEVTYGGLVQERKRGLHGAIVEAIERMEGDQPDEQVERLAQHAYEGQVWDKALIYLQRAGSKARKQSAHQDATRNLEHALNALKNLPESREVVEQSIDIRLALRASLHGLGEFERTIDHLRDAETLAKDLDDPHRLGQVYSYMTNYFCRTGNPDHAIDMARRALALNQPLGDLSIEIPASYYLAGALLSKGEYARAKEGFIRNIALVTGELVYERFRLSGLQSVIARTWLVWCLAERGEFDEGMGYAKDAIRIAEESDEPFSLAASIFRAGFLLLRRGQITDSLSVLERSLEVCRTASIGI